MEPRIQKKEGRQWDPLAVSIECLADLKKAVDSCHAEHAIASTGCVFGNAEAAFYEKLADEEQMNKLKDESAILRSKFAKKCRCDKIKN